MRVVHYKRKIGALLILLILNIVTFMGRFLWITSVGHGNYVIFESDDIIFLGVPELLIKTIFFILVIRQR